MLLKIAGLNVFLNSWQSCFSIYANAKRRAINTMIDPIKYQILIIYTGTFSFKFDAKIECWNWLCEKKKRQKSVYKFVEWKGSSSSSSKVFCFYTYAIIPYERTFNTFLVYKCIISVHFLLWNDFVLIQFTFDAFSVCLFFLLLSLSPPPFVCMYFVQMKGFFMLNKRQHL